MTPSPEPCSNEVAVQASGLAVGYAGAAVVSGIDLEVCRGHALAIVGTNGSGKSTLLRTIVGLQPPLGGRVETLGRPPGQIAGRLAYLSQFHASGFVLPLRAIDVVRMGRYPSLGMFGRMSADDHRLVRDALDRMGVGHLVQSPLRSLSGGQQQRVYISQVLARQADLVVLDEPTAGLDAAGRELFEVAMGAELGRGATIITATHDIQDASECDLVLALARRVVAFGPPQDVLDPDTLLETFGIAVRGHVHGVRAIGSEQPYDMAGQPRS